MKAQGEKPPQLIEIPKFNSGKRGETLRELIDRLHENTPLLIERIETKLYGAGTERREFSCTVGNRHFNLKSRDGKVVSAPYLLKWMEGMTLQEIKPWLLEKRAKVIEVTKQQSN